MASPAAAESWAALTSTAEEALYEVVDGQRVELPHRSFAASWLMSRLHVSMGSFAEAGRLGTVVAEALFILDPVRNLRRRPDVAFLSAQKWPLERLFPEEGDLEVVPDLAVEVSSPNDLLDAVLAKMQEYFAFGVRLVWVVNPNRQIVLVFDSPTQVRILAAGDELDGGTLLPGFRLPLARLFQPKHQAGTPAHA